MTKASIAELKSNPSRYIRLAERGEPVVVTAHRRPVARLMRIEPAGAAPVPIIPPTRNGAKLKDSASPRLTKHLDGVAILLEERRRR